MRYSIEVEIIDLLTPNPDVHQTLVHQFENMIKSTVISQVACVLRVKSVEAVSDAPNNS